VEQHSPLMEEPWELLRVHQQQLVAAGDIDLGDNVCHGENE